METILVPANLHGQTIGLAVDLLANDDLAKGKLEEVTTSSECSTLTCADGPRLSNALPRTVRTVLMDDRIEAIDRVLSGWGKVRKSSIDYRLVGLRLLVENDDLFPWFL